MAKKDARGRSKSGPPFVALYHYMVDSAAWRALTAGDRAVYVALARRYNGSNNGFLSLSARDAAAASRQNKDTAAHSLKRLQTHGFIEIAQPSSFNRKDRTAAEYRLTVYPCHRTGTAPTKAFMRWSPNSNNSPKSGSPQSEIRGPSVQDNALTVPSNRTVEAI